MPRVSVIVPVYNVEPYLAECLDSALGQSLEDIEVICVNDGSSDGSLEILAAFAARDKRITVIDQANQGLSSARNAGIAAASGEFVVFLDSDDRLDLGALQELYATASEHSLDVLLFDARAFFDDESLEQEHADYAEYYRRSTEYATPTDGKTLLAQMHAARDYLPSACLQLIRLSFYHRALLFFWEGLAHEDNLFTFTCLLSAERAAHVSRPFLQRRIRHGSIMTAEKGVANCRSFLVTYVEMMRYSRFLDLDEQQSRAVARLIAGAYNDALRVLVTLNRDVWDAATRFDGTPEALSARALVEAHAAAVLGRKEHAAKSKQLHRKLDETKEKLRRVTSSRSYQLIRWLRALLRPRR